MSDAVVLLGCGDVGPIHGPVGRYSEPVRNTLMGADIRFAGDSGMKSATDSDLISAIPI